MTLEITNKEVMMRSLKYLVFGGIMMLALSVAGVSGASAINYEDKMNYEGVITCYRTDSSSGGLINRTTLEDFDGSASGLLPNNSKIVPRIGSEESKISCYDLMTSKTALKLSQNTNMTAGAKRSVLESIKYQVSQSGVSGVVNAVNNAVNSDSKCYAFPYIERNTSGGTDKVLYSQNFCASNNTVSFNGAINSDGYIKFEPVSGSSVKVTANNKRCVFDISDGSISGCNYSGFSSELNFKNDPVKLIASVGNFIASNMGSTPDTGINDVRYDGSTSTHGDRESNARTEYKVFSACQNYAAHATGINCTSHDSSIEAPSVALTTNSDMNAVYVKPNLTYTEQSTGDVDTANQNINEVTKIFSGGSVERYSDLKFTDAEKYQLYDYYLKDIFKITSPACSDGATVNGAGQYSARMWWSEQNKFATCYFNTGDGVNINNIKVYGVNDNGHFGRLMTFNEVITALNGLTSLEENPGDAIAENEENTEAKSIGQLCQGSDIVGVKWALCPALENMTYTANGLDSTIADMLEVDTSLYGMTDKSGQATGTYIVWEIMRNVANIAMVIFLMVIIFSQLTGYGIDNYGIKKMLPRLIIMAILINLSFYICEIIIDISNVLGEALRNLFGGVGNMIQERNGFDFGEGFISTLVTALLGGTAGVGAMSGTIVTVGLLAGGGAGSLVMIIIMVLLALVAIIFAVLLFFAMLGARMILIIGCVVAAPVVFACYILPNTQNIFKMWKKLFEACLVIFPICGAIGGMSHLIKAIVFSLDGVHAWMAVVAMLAPFLPFFILPTLLRSAISMLGKVGAGITAMGNAVRSGAARGRSAAEGALQNSGAYKDATRRAQGARAERSNAKYAAAKKRVNELLAKQKSGTLTGAEQRELRGAQRRTNAFRTRQNALNSQLLDRQSAEDVEAARVTMRAETGDYDNEIMATQLDNILSKVDGGTATKEDETKARALMAQLASQAGGASKLADLTTKYDKATGNITAERTGSSARFVGQYMAQNEKVRGAIESKNRYGASRIKDIASGVISDDIGQADYDKMDAGYLSYLRERRANGESIDGDMEESAWKNNQIMTNPNYVAKTVSQDITRDVLDKDKDFVTQKGGVVTRYAGELGQERINKMASNNTLFGMGDIADGVERTIKGLASAPVSSTEYVDMGGDRTYEVRSSGGRNYVVQDGREINVDVQKLENAGYQTRDDYNKMVAGFRQQEDDALRIGKKPITYVDSNSGVVSSFDGYAVPAGFDDKAIHTVRDGQHIYRDRNNGREWNATTGRYTKY